ncbi:MAG TPA: DUF1631 family protein [Caldimonas sp.]|jgi:hypothetical protein|nr:DUF1631 family protein [Caldimonas sp.]
MSLSDPSVNAVLAAAQDRIRATADSAVVEVANSLLVLMKSAGTYRERGQLAFAQIHILESRELFLTSFATALRERIGEDIAARSENRAAGGETDWQSISLVDEGQIEEKISFERIGQLIAHRSEAELRELDGYMSTMLRHGWADPQKNPLRGAILGSALHKAIEKITDEPDTQKIFGRELGQAMANAMPACYLEIVAGLKQRGLKPTDLAMRPADEFSARPAARAPGAGAAFDEARKAWEMSWQGRMGAAPGEPLRSWEQSMVGRFANADAPAAGIDPESSAALLDRLIRGGMPGSFAVPGAARAPAAVEADAELMNLLRRLNGGATYQGEFDALPRDTGYGGYTGQGGDDFAPTTRSGVPLGVSYTQPPSSGLTGLMAANLIRAHRAELLQASRGKLDHLVIEVVSSLFDQILSDTRVPPQMARQIARLQLPVLRAALTDGSFFSSRRHPVRRFINRIASLACAFDSFDSGPAKELLERISGLVKEIVDGDFDQLDLYDAKLLELERFVAEQTHAEIRESAAAATLRGKELEWRIQQRFSQQLRAALEPLALPAFLRDFLGGVWGQAIVVASRRDGADAAYPGRLRRAGADLVRSIQPKRSLDERKQFVAGLPALMAELTQGMKFVDWPQAAQDEFFGQLVTQHAGSLKGTARSELDHNMLVRHLETAFKTPLPSAEEAAGELAPGPAEAAPLEQRFSIEEELAIGLVSENQVDWSRDVSPAQQPSAPETAPAPAATVPPAAGGDGGEAPLPTLSAADAIAPPADAGVAAKEEAAESPELAPGPQLRDHLQLGFSYQLNLKDQWQKVRLTYMSPARSLFLFSHGAKGRETISMTARTLGRLCAAGRMRAFENAFLIDRATQRARQQLATIGRAPV